MREQIEVVFENGVLRPLVALSGHFQEQQRLTVIIEDGAVRDWLADADPTVSLDAVRQSLSKAPTTLAQMVRAEREER